MPEHTKIDPWKQPEACAFQQLVTDDPALGKLFRAGEAVVVARAPGRLDVMGGIADYSGSLVLQWPIEEATYTAAQRADDGLVRVISLGQGSGEADRTSEIACAELEALVESGYGAVGKLLWSRRGEDWAAYPIGCLAVLMRECGAEIKGGIRLLVRSTVPEGKGVSSSAALEVASMAALAELLEARLEGEELARLCQIAENRVAGAPCGIMDQMTAAAGHENRLLALLCQPATVEGHLEVPVSIRFWGIDSGIRHSVSGSDYTAVRTGAFMGYRIVAQDAGFVVSDPDLDCRVTVDDPVWQGYLANVGVSRYEARYAATLPVTLSGKSFLERFGGTTDTVTKVDPRRTYAVRLPTEHPIREHERVNRFRDLLTGSPGERELEEMGSLMYASHASYSACGLGSDGTDRLVDLVREAGPAAGLYGAKITGGGCGGTVAVLGRAGAAGTIESIAQQYSRETSRKPRVFAGSSPGAVRSGTHRLERAFAAHPGLPRSPEAKVDSR